MKHFILLLSLLFCNVAFALGAEPDSSAEPQQLQFSVAIQDDGARTMSWNTTAPDGKGVSVEEARYRADGTLESETNYHRDAAGVLQRSTRLSFQPDGRIATFEYSDADGKLLQRDRYFALGVGKPGYITAEIPGGSPAMQLNKVGHNGIELARYSYDRSGELESSNHYSAADGTRMTYTFEKGRLQKKSQQRSNHTQVTTYDAAGLRQSEKSFNPDGTPRSTLKYSYNARRQLLRIEEQSKTPDDDMRMVFDYDSQHRYRRVTAYKGKLVQGINEVILDDAGKSAGMVMKGFDEKGEPAGRMVMRFGKDGGGAEALEYDAGGQLEKRSVYAGKQGLVLEEFYSDGVKVIADEYKDGKRAFSIRYKPDGTIEWRKPYNPDGTITFSSEPDSKQPTENMEKPNG